MINNYDNETRLTAILRCVVDDTADAAMLQQLGPARTREEIFVSRALGKKPWAAIPPRTTLEMWLAFIAEDEAEPAAGSYTVRSCAESCIITYARRVKGASAIVPIFPPHSPYEIALAKLAGIIPVSYGVQGRPWELLINQLAEQGPRENIAVIYGSTLPHEGGQITPLQDLTGGPPSPEHICPIFPGLSLIRDDGSRLDVYGGTLNRETGLLISTMGIVDLSTLTWSKSNHDNPNGTVFLSPSPCPFVRWQIAGVSAISDALVAASADGAWIIEASNTFWWNEASTGWRTVWGAGNKGSTITEFSSMLNSVKPSVVALLQDPITIQLTPTELQRALGCTKYLGVGAWKLCPGVVTVITAQLTTSEATTHYDLAPSEAEGWTFEISVDGQTTTGTAGALNVAAGEHSITITATPAAGAAACYIQPTLYSEVTP